MPLTVQNTATENIVFDGLKTTVPLLLLPVRLETRFTQDRRELHIRIYPDAVHMNSFNPELTDTEKEWGEHFWNHTKLANQNEALERNAWAQLVQLFGPLRAAWIARQLSSEKLETGGPNGPTAPPAPCAELVPDYWIASGRLHKKENDQAPWTFVSDLFVKGQTVKGTDGDRILVMPRKDGVGSSPTLKDDPDAGWLVDFVKAEQNGMGLRMNVNLPDAPFIMVDPLFVYGVKASITTDQGKIRLQNLLLAHHHTQGLAFVPQGTPTNNTLAASSGYSSGDPGAHESFEVERKLPPPTNPDDVPNLLVMAEALGIDADYLTHIREAYAVEQRDARDMNNLLWKSTWNYFLEQMLELGGQHAGKIDQMREHFVRYVRARGPLPTLRIGRQPYGVLPVMPLGEPGHDSVTTGPIAGLRALRQIWRTSLAKVPRLKRPSEPIDGQQDFSLTLLQVLAMTPMGISYVGRPCTRIVPVSSPISDDGRANTGHRPLPADLQEALDALLESTTVTPHQRTVFATQSSVFSVRKPPVGDHDFGNQDASSIFNILRDTDPSKQASLAHLNALHLRQPDAVDLLFKETLDLCSHRLDAWVTSLATKRLHQLRHDPAHPDQAKGICIGGYGWVEELKPDSDKRSHGFIHAPSLAHATTAALLRSAYESRRLSETPLDGNALAVNLASNRVRLALHLIDGVRGGQSLGVLLGYRFERGLHERGLRDGTRGLFLDQYIPAFRYFALLKKPDASGAPDPQKARTTNVVDGLVLLNCYKDSKKPGGKPILWGQPLNGSTYKLPDTGSLEQKACEAELINLEDAVDAVADLVLAESVHHLAQGNQARAGATLEAIARGEAPPPDLDFIRTPRTGINHTHRLGVLFGDRPATTPAPWGIETPRAQAEPVLNDWVAQVLGPRADEAFCAVTYTVDGTERPLPPVMIKDLGLAPLDLVYLLDGEVGGNQSEIEQRILYYLQEGVLKDQPSITKISLKFMSSAGGSPPSLAEVLEVARTIRRFVTGARVLEPRDLDLPENAAVDAPSGKDSSLIDRAKAAREAFAKSIQDLAKELPDKPEDPITNPTAVRQALKNLAAYGIMGAIPTLPLNPNEHPEKVLKNLYAQASAVLEEAILRQKGADSFPADIQNDTQAIGVLHNLFGDAFSALPLFKPENGDALNQTFSKSNNLQGGKPQASLTWFQRVARVREGCSRLDAVMLYANALNGPELSFQVGQLPFRDGEPWVALENTLSENRLSLVLLTPARSSDQPQKIDFTKPVAGLMIDEWVESIPNKEEITGLAFHFDAPQPRAPQALLLAMSPEGIDTWDSATLENTLRETLELAKLRAVDITALGVVGQYLPAMYVQHDSTGKSPLVK